MHTTLLVFSYPREAQYSQIPAEYDGEAIEDYSVQRTEFKPNVGQGIHGKYHYWGAGNQWTIGEREWIIGKVHQYQALGDGEGTFSIAVLSFDGSPVDMETESGDLGLVQILLTPDSYQLSWPQHINYAKNLGDELYDEPYTVAKITQFEPCPGESVTIYNDVRLGWCIPVDEPAPALAL